MRLRLIATCAAGVALFCASLANVVPIPVGWHTPSPSSGVGAGYLYASTGEIHWNMAMTATNNYYTGVPHFNARATLRFFRVTNVGYQLVGAFVYNIPSYFVLYPWSGVFYTVPGTYWFSLTADADQLPTYKFRDNVVFSWNLANVSAS